MSPAAKRDRIRKRFDHGPPISGIDTRPMVFVTLFVAIVFLLAANQTRKHILLIELPQADPSHPISWVDPRIVHRISVLADDTITLDGAVMSGDGLNQWLAKLSKEPVSPIIAFEPDADASFNRAVHVLRQIKLAGLAEWSFCMTGLEKHRDFEYDGFNLRRPMRFTIHLDENNSGATEWMRAPDFESCDPMTLHPPLR